MVQLGDGVQRVKTEDAFFVLNGVHFFVRVDRVLLAIKLLVGVAQIETGLFGCGIVGVGSQELLKRPSRCGEKIVRLLLANGVGFGSELFAEF